MAGAEGGRGLLGSRDGRSEPLGGWLKLGWGIGTGKVNPPTKPLGPPESYVPDSFLREELSEDCVVLREKLSSVLLMEV
jgi:hypothetical protein